MDYTEVTLHYDCKNVTGCRKRLLFTFNKHHTKWNHSLDFFLYITKQFTLDLWNSYLSKFLISQSKTWVLLYISHCFSLLITRSGCCVHTQTIKLIIMDLLGWSGECHGASVVVFSVFPRPFLSGGTAMHWRSPTMHYTVPPCFPLCFLDSLVHKNTPIPCFPPHKK